VTAIANRTYGGTGLTLEQLREMPREARHAILAGTIDVLRGELKEKEQQLAESEGMLRDEMRERGATVAAAGQWEVRLKPSKKYEYDVEGLSKLQAFIDPEDYDRAVQPIPATLKVNKAELNKLAKRGTDIAEIIEAATTTVPGPYTVEVEKRKR
jgi:hypothetical protein